MKVYKIFFFLLFCIIGLNQCDRNGKAHSFGFYYWRSLLALDKNEKQILNRSTLPYLYARFFDIVKQNDQFLEVGNISADKNFKADKKIIPVIFITNESWFNIKSEEIEFLAGKINENINLLALKNHLNLGNEIQIDSDWTKGTKDDYFKFLKILREISGKNITCTLRLHQVKDKTETGIPPVKKMYLMCYATSSPLENSDKNSILDVKALQSYLRKLDQYPVKLDVALPIYSWGIVTNHLGKKKLINALTAAQLSNNKNFKKINKNTFEILKDDFYFGMYLNKGFKIKTEEISEKDILESIKFIDGKLNYPFNIIYYHLDSRFTKNYKTLFNEKIIVTNYSGF